MTQTLATRPRRGSGIAAPFVLVALTFGAVAAGLCSPQAAGAAIPAARKAKCTSKPFVGTVERTAETGSSAAQPAAERATADLRSALVFDFGTRKNFTVYAGDYRIDADDLGGTLTAPDGKVLVTMFLRAANGKDLRAGQTLVVGKDPVSVIVDAGGGAQAVTSSPEGKVKVLDVTDDRVCFLIDYSDDFQAVEGVVNAKIP